MSRQISTQSLTVKHSIRFSPIWILLAFTATLIPFVSSSSLRPCSTYSTCYDCTGDWVNNSTVSECGWCSTRSTESGAYGRCINITSSSPSDDCTSPSVITSQPNSCLIPVACSVIQSCARCVDRSMPVKDNEPACGWRYQKIAGNEIQCGPIIASERTSEVGTLQSTCPPLPWLVPGRVSHLVNTLGIIIFTVILFALFLVCFRSKVEFRWRLQGIPCSAGMVANYFDWSGLEDDGFGGVGAEPATPDSEGIRNSWCPHWKWPFAQWQWSTIGDAVIAILFACGLFIDRWFETARREGSPMESRIIWGNIGLRYGSGGGITGPPSHTYDCSNLSILSQVMRDGQCGGVKATGILTYIFGLVYFILIGIRLYTCIYVSIRNVALVAHRHRRSNRGLSIHKRRAGTWGLHRRFVKSFIQIRYLRFYMALFVIGPFVLWRLLTLSDAYSSISPTTLDVSAIFLLFCILLELVGVIWEVKRIIRILDRLDSEAEERRRRGAINDEDDQHEGDEYGLNPSTAPRTVRPGDEPRAFRPNHLQPDSNELMREYMEQSELAYNHGHGGLGFNRLSSEDYESAEQSTWARSDLEEDRQYANQGHEQQQPHHQQVERTTPSTHTVHAPIYSSYDVPSTIAVLPSSSSSSSASAPHVPHSTEMSVLAPPSRSTRVPRQLNEEKNDIDDNRDDDSDDEHTLVLENHTSYQSDHEDENDENDVFDL